jgi:predicted O-linked N-acetylglucosamine transferase (SPINDLY family)
MTAAALSGGTTADRADRLIADGNALEDRGLNEAARARYEEAVELAPDYPRARMNLGNALRKLERPDEAAQAFRRALAVAPEYVPARFNLGSLLTSRGDFDSAEVELREALRRQPDLAEAMLVLADVLEATGRVEEAEKQLVRALELRRDLGGAALNLGHLMARSNRFEEAEHWLLEARRLDPVAYRSALSDYCFLLLLRGDVDVATLFNAHRRIGAAIAAEAGPPFVSHPNPRDPRRRLRIGYVSGDFRQHPMGLFMRPILAAHDRSMFDVHCYSSVEKADEATEVLRAAVPHWHEVGGLADAEVAELIRSHGIDVLIDLAGHTDNPRLGTFARKPAPVQVTWMGYLNTTGLAAMDYRICDRHAERVGVADALHTERLYRLPHSQWCYVPWYDVPVVAVPHADRPEALVLGSFNQSQKIGDATLDLWSRVLLALPDAEIHLFDFREERARRSLRERLSRRGIADTRVTVRGREPIVDYLRAISNVDIALDPYPYNGATTTLDTLWMGTPLVALAGERGVSRGSYSILQTLQLPELIALTPEEYVRINADLARNATWRRTLRSELRSRMKGSPLMDVPGFVADLERAYRSMWLSWCTSTQS